MKKRTLFSFTAFLFLFLVFKPLPDLRAQEINKTDAKGLKQGKWIKKYSNGAVRYEGSFKDNRPVGEFKYYYPTGKIKAVTRYEEDGETAYTKTFYLNGRELAEGKYVNRKRDGIWKFYSEKDSTLITEVPYKKGVIDGKKIIYFPENGKPSQIIEYKNGLKNGTLRSFFTDGKPNRIETYRNDTLNGPFKVYFPEGGVQIEGFYKNGYQDSLWKTYDVNGKLIKQETFSRGMLRKKGQ